jgi:2-enoate reductase
MVMLGRALLADPWWPHKVEHGNVDDIRPCIACHDGCIARCDGGKVVSCTVNPQACRETQFVLQKSEIPKKIAVVGGGMAGMEAARVSAIRGHEVTLFEKGTRLGGRVHEASVPDFKEDERRLFSWYEKQLRDLAIDVKLNTLFTDTLALNDGYDKILYAGGAKPCFASTEVNGFKTVEASEFLLSFDESDPAKEYLIVGAGLVGCEIAIWLSKKGKKVTLVEQKEQKGMVLEDSGLFYSNIQMINDLLRFYEVKIFCQHYMLKAEDGKVTIISNDFKQKTLSADKVIFAVGYKVDDAEYEKIKAIHQDVYKLGDAKKVGNFLSAIWDGFLIAKDI